MRVNYKVMLHNNVDVYAAQSADILNFYLPDLKAQVSFSD